MIRRGQLLVRNCGPRPSRTPVSDCALPARTDYAAIGILEVPSDSYDEKLLRGFISHLTESGPVFLFTEFAQPVNDAADDDFGHLATRTIWPRPSIASQFGGGGLLLRNTRMPAAPGHRIVLALAICSLAPGSLHDSHMYEVNGTIGAWPTALTLRDQPGSIELCHPNPCPVEMGHSLANLLKQPLWGWSDEKVAFVSTLDLATIDAVHHLQSLMSVPNPSPEQQAEIDATAFTPAGQMLRASHTDPQFERFRARMIQEQGPLRWDAVETGSQASTRSALASRIIRELQD